MVNSHLKYLYIKKNIFFIDHTQTIKSQNLNKSKLYLNKTGDGTLRDNFIIKAISDIFR